jgi:hypothetical protein
MCLRYLRLSGVLSGYQGIVKARVRQLSSIALTFVTRTLALEKRLTVASVSIQTFFCRAKLLRSECTFFHLFFLLFFLLLLDFVLTVC